MGRITLNIAQETFESASDRSDFPLVPAGKYKVNVYEASEAECQSENNKGKPQIKVQFKIQDGETAPDGTEQGNRRLFKTFNFFGEKPFDTINFLKAIGTSYEEAATDGIDPDDLNGLELEVTVKHRQRMDKDSGWKKPLLGDDGKPVMQEEVSGFRSADAAATAGAAKATAGKGGKKTYSL